MFSLGGHNYNCDDKLEIVNNEPFYYVIIGDDGEIKEKIECWSEEDFIRAISKRRNGGSKL